MGAAEGEGEEGRVCDVGGEEGGECVGGVALCYLYYGVLLVCVARDFKGNLRRCGVAGVGVVEARYVR